MYQKIYSTNQIARISQSTANILLSMDSKCANLFGLTEFNGFAFSMLHAQILDNFLPAQRFVNVFRCVGLFRWPNRRVERYKFLMRLVEDCKLSADSGGFGTVLCLLWLI